MFKEGNLLKFKPFIFKNGAEPKDKYFIVLKRPIEGNILLASLPTSKDHVPSDIETGTGCLELPERQVNVFIFSAKENIAIHPESLQSFSFPLNTFIYGADIDSYPVEAFEQQIETLETQVELIGKITSPYMEALKLCFKHSKMVKNKYRKML